MKIDLGKEYAVDIFIWVRTESRNKAINLRDA
jgi:hypothetical protein